MPAALSLALTLLAPSLVCGTIHVLLLISGPTEYAMATSSGHKDEHEDDTYAKHTVPPPPPPSPLPWPRAQGRQKLFRRRAPSTVPPVRWWVAAGVQT